MTDEVNNVDGTQPAVETPQRYKLDEATRLVPMQTNEFGQPFWESFHTPESFQVSAEAQVPPHLPGVIIFVHGVNSEGEWYKFAEEGLCAGLNERLGLTGSAELRQNKFISEEVDPISGKTRKIPRRIDPEWNGRSPIIHFYWGYRAADGHEKDWRIALQDMNGFDYWSPACPASQGPWFWGGGPFQNGTNNLQQLWSDAGFKRHVLGCFDAQTLNTEVDRQLQDAPSRTYYAYAAQRLADLIDKIRNNSGRDTVTLMSHSQGTMIAMAATTLCKTRAPDALFVMNSPFAMDDKITDALQSHRDRPTAQARVNTFRNIANRIKQDKRVFTEEQMQQVHVGATHDLNFWRPDVRLRCGMPERDNHGRLYVYFTPHDRVMGAIPLQSIGWQGIDDKLLEELGDTVKQRMLARCTPVGDEPGVQKFGTLPLIQVPMDRVQPDEFWNGNRQILNGLIGTLWAVPKRNKTVTINAEKVPNPLTAEDMKPFEESRKDARKWGEFVTDRTDPNKGYYKDGTYPYMRSIYQPERWLDHEDVYATNGRTRSKETQEEMVDYINNYVPEPTNHSTLPSHVEFMKRVVAYDLPVGFCDAYDNLEFWTELMHDADWISLKDPYFTTGTLNTPAMPSSIDGQKIDDTKTQADIQALYDARNG
jgi:pimeloyl-ACP methyl ester carboxylesterase